MIVVPVAAGISKTLAFVLRWGLSEMLPVPHDMGGVRDSAAFHRLHGTRVGRICDELQRGYQIAPELILFLLLGMVTLACQDGTFVRMRNGTAVPFTGYFVLSGAPGTGKSTILTRLLEPFCKAEAAAAEESAHRQRRYQADRLIWRRRVQHLALEIDEAIAAGKDVHGLSELFPDEPHPPRTPSWLVEDTTVQALRRRLHKGWPSAGIVLDEGIRFFASPLSRAFADFCTLYDARLARNERVTTGVESVDQAFLSMIIATQPGPLFEFLNAHGERAFKTGFLARVQLLDVQQQGLLRPLSGGAIRHEALDEYDERVVFLKRDACRRMRDSGTFEPVIIDLSEPAGRILDEVPQLMGTRLAGARCCRHLEPYLNRLPVLMARLAGVLHQFEGLEGPVDEQTMRTAMEIGFWLAEETGKVLMRLGEPSAAEKADVDVLVRTLYFHALWRRRAFITKGELLAMAPSFGLDEARCKRALHALCGAHWVWQESRGNATFIRMSPQIFPAC